MAGEKDPQRRVVDGHWHVACRKGHERSTRFVTKADRAKHANEREPSYPHQSRPQVAPARLQACVSLPPTGDAPPLHENSGTFEPDTDEQRGHGNPEERVTTLADVIGETVEGRQKWNQREGKHTPSATLRSPGNHNLRRDKESSGADPAPAPSHV